MTLIYIYIYIYIEREREEGEMINFVKSDMMKKLSGYIKHLQAGFVVMFRSLFTEELLQTLKKFFREKEQNITTKPVVRV